jgi:hypothetical protein
LGALASLTTVLVCLAEVMTGYALVVLLRVLYVLAMMAVMALGSIPTTGVAQVLLLLGTGHWLLLDWRRRRLPRITHAVGYAAVPLTRGTHCRHIWLQMLRPRGITTSGRHRAMLGLRMRSRCLARLLQRMVLK